MMKNDDKYFNTKALVDEVLKKEPGYSLPDNFAENIASRVARKSIWENYFREFLIYLGLIAGLVIITIAMAFIWYNADWKAWLNFLTNHIWIIAGVNILALFVLFVDRVLLRYFLDRTTVPGEQAG